MLTSCQRSGSRLTTKPRETSLIRVPRPRRTYHHGDLAQALRRAAIAAIEEDPSALETLNLRELARTLGVSPAAPYRHYANREALLAALATDGFRLLGATMETRRERAGADPKARFLATGAGYVEFAVSHPGAFRVTFGPRGDVEDVELEEAAARAFMVVMSTVGECRRAGMLRKGGDLEHTVCAWAAMHGLATLLGTRQLERVGKTAADAEELSALVAGVVWSGIGA